MKSNMKGQFYLWLLGFLGNRYKTGSFIFFSSNETKILEVKTGFTPKKVWISLKEPKGIAVCHGDVDCVDIRIIPHGFCIIVNIKSSCREVQWVAVR